MPYWTNVRLVSLHLYGFSLSDEAMEFIFNQKIRYWCYGSYCKISCQTLHEICRIVAVCFGINICFVHVLFTVFLNLQLLLFTVDFINIIHIPLDWDLNTLWCWHLKQHYHQIGCLRILQKELCFQFGRNICKVDVFWWIPVKFGCHKSTFNLLIVDSFALSWVCQIINPQIDSILL